MCIRGVEVDPSFLQYVSDMFVTQEMCDKAVEKYPWLLEYVSDWFVSQQQLKLWHDSDDYYDDVLIEWYEGYKK